MNKFNIQYQVTDPTMTNSQNYHHHHRAADQTYYDILGIPREADPTAIRKAYLRVSCCMLFF